jgi:hypothetical protein
MKLALARIGVGLLAAAAVTDASAPASARRVETVTLAVAGRANAAVSVQAVGAFTVVAWAATAVGGPTDIYAAVSRDSGRTFGAPARVNDVDGDASVGGEQPPRVALVPRAGSDPAIVVVWTAKQKSGTRILVSRSEDGGSSFGHASPFADGDAAGNRGWEAIATDQEGGVVAVWLDHREMAGSGSPAGAAMHYHGQDHAAAGQAPANGAARAQRSKLYFARLGNGANLAGGQAIAAGVCYCCKTAIATAPDGSIYAAWRHVYPGNIRDIAFTASRDGGRTFANPVRVSDDRWALDGCPENGPSIAVDGRTRIHVVWPTLVSGRTAGAEPTLELFHATSGDGVTFTPRRRLPSEGVPRHTQIVASPDDRLSVVWEEQASGTRRVVIGRSRGDAPFTRQILSGPGRAEYPAVASSGGSTLVAWSRELDNRSVIEIARLPD